MPENNVFSIKRFRAATHLQRYHDYFSDSTRQALDMPPIAIMKKRIFTKMLQS